MLRSKIFDEIMFLTAINVQSSKIALISVQPNVNQYILRGVDVYLFSASENSTY